MTIITSDIQLYQILKQKMGEKEAEALVGIVDAKIRDNNEVNLKILATKEDISKLQGEISRLDVKISDTKADLVRRVFAFVVTLMLAIIGLYFKS